MLVIYLDAIKAIMELGVEVGSIDTKDDTFALRIEAAERGAPQYLAQMGRPGGTRNEIHGFAEYVTSALSIHCQRLM